MNAFWRLSGALAGAAMLVATPAWGAELLVSVAPVRSTLNAGDRVGSKRTGRLCLPAGSIRWSEVAPDSEDVALDIASALRSGSVDVVSPTESMSLPIGTSLRRVSATVKSAAVDACVPQTGLVRLIGGRSRLKAEGRLTVRWQVFQAGQSAPVWDQDVSVTLDEPKPGDTLTSLVRSALQKSAVDNAQHLTGRPTN